jgi:transposase InsO family protein
MMKEAEQYVNSCGPCSRNKRPQRHARAEMIKYNAGSPMERVHLDFLGPLPETPKGNVYVLVMVDQFTKWVECVPLPSQTAELTASAAVNEFFARFGCPFQVFTDQGRNFESKLFTSICELLQIHKARTTPYRPSANGQVERYNRSLMDTVRCYIDKAQNHWDEHLAQIAGALRSAVNIHTGYTANSLMLGREVNTPADLMFGDVRKDPPVDIEAYVLDLERATQMAHETARSRLKTSEKRMKRDYDLKEFTRSYNLGDLVLCPGHSHSEGKVPKVIPFLERTRNYLEKTEPPPLSG